MVDRVGMVLSREREEWLSVACLGRCCQAERYSGRCWHVPVRVGANDTAASGPCQVFSCSQDFYAAGTSAVNRVSRPHQKAERYRPGDTLIYRREFR